MSTQSTKDDPSRSSTAPSATKPDEPKPRSWVMPLRVISHTSSPWFAAVRTRLRMKKSKALPRTVAGARASGDIKSPKTPNSGE